MKTLLALLLLIPSLSWGEVYVCESIYAMNETTRHMSTKDESLEIWVHDYNSEQFFHFIENEEIRVKNDHWQSSYTYFLSTDKKILTEIFKQKNKDNELNHYKLELLENDEYGMTFKVLKLNDDTDDNYNRFVLHLKNKTFSYTQIPVPHMLYRQVGRC